MTCKSCRDKPKTYRCWFCDDANLAAQQTPHPAGWPMVSDAAAVHPSQAKEATEDAAKKGVPTEFTKGGRPIFTSQGHRAAYCKAYGYRDRNGSYGDYTGTSDETERQAMFRTAKERQRDEVAAMFLSGGE